MTAVLRGKLKRKDDDRVVAGDVVELDVRGDGPAAITGVHPRRSLLARRSSGARGPGRRQPIAANVDQVVVVAAARDPEPNFRMLDRLLVIAEANRIPPVLVLNKLELDRAALELFRRRYGPAGYQVLATSVHAAEGLPALRDLLRGRASVLAGESGVGKSSLVNALQPGLNLRIGEISEKWGRGKHTTRAAQLVPLAGGGGGAYVVDTPGLREVAAWGVDPELLAPCFSTSAASTIVAIWLSRIAACARPRSGARSTSIGSFRTGTSTTRSAFLPGPAVGVAGVDLRHHGVEGLIQIDPLGIGEADDHEENVG